MHFSGCSFIDSLIQKTPHEKEMPEKNKSHLKNIGKPIDPITINEGEIPVFWCCGVTPQSVVMSAKPPIAISHAPGHMFITDVKNSKLKD